MSCLAVVMSVMSYFTVSDRNMLQGGGVMAKGVGSFYGTVSTVQWKELVIQNFKVNHVSDTLGLHCKVT